MPVNAPYRFAPIHRWVHIPAWQALVSHDVPFKDGLSGEVDIAIEAMTPLLIGGERRRGSPTTAGEIFPLLLPDGTPIIPPAALQGMTRSLLEVAAFGRLGDWIDDRRVGYRDLGDSTTADIYFKRRMTRRNPSGVILPQSKAGWLFRDGNGARLLPCEHARIEFEDFVGLRGVVTPPSALQSRLNARSDAQQRYNQVFGGNFASLNVDVHIGPRVPRPHRGGAIQIEYAKAVPVGPTRPRTHDATIVLTGKTNGNAWTSSNHSKHMEFVFHSPSRNSASKSLAGPVGADIWRDFGEIHEERPGRAMSAAWAFWRGEFNSDRPIPVFYLFEGGRVTTIFIAFMGKTALNRSLRGNLENSSSRHLEDRATRALDLPCLIFGDSANDAPASGLKRRANFGLARGTLPEPTPTAIRRSDDTLLLGPKPSYFPIYMRQPPSNNAPGRLLNNSPHVVSGVPDYPTAGVGLTDSHRRPELAGVKIWPAPHNDACSFPYLPAPPPQGGQKNCSTHVRLNALPRNTQFSTVLRFHNLRPMELGAILWALTFDEAAALGDRLPDVSKRHRLGMGKAFGMGSVRIALGDMRIRANAAGPMEHTPASLCQAFVAHMTAAYRHAPNAPPQGWSQSPQVRALMKAADPAQNPTIYVAGENGAVRPYMSLEQHVASRNANEFLPPYVPVGAHNEFPKPRAAAE